MIIEKMGISGLTALIPEPSVDERGYFERIWCKNELSKFCINTNIVQCNHSYNIKKGTLRGLHFQREPYGEEKYVMCISGEVFDVVVDLRKQSKTFLKWYGIVLSAENRKLLYIPKGCAHGFLTLKNDTNLFYMMTHPYVPDAACGIRYNDPAIQIKWIMKEENLIISERDRTWPLLYPDEGREKIC